MAPLNLPPRLLRVAVVCITFVATFAVTGRLLVLKLASPTIPFSSNGTLALTHWPELRPSWTTEQEDPKFAYAQYATTLDYLCNAVINFALLNRYGARHEFVLIYPKSWSQGTSAHSRAIESLKAVVPGIHHRPFDILSTQKGDSTWRDSLTKFHSFALTEWTRILIFDSDSLVLNSMDHYFLSPLAPVAVPRAYWLNGKDTEIGRQILGSHVMLIEPNEARYRKILAEAQRSGEFDMEVVNNMFRDSAMILPHRRLALLTGEFRRSDHSQYLAPDHDEEWNAVREVSRSFLVHFSDWPLPKPWQPRTAKQWEDALPACPEDNGENASRHRCADRVVWTGLYDMYDAERKKQCAALYQQ